MDARTRGRRGCKGWGLERERTGRVVMLGFTSLLCSAGKRRWDGKEE